MSPWLSLAVPLCWFGGLAALKSLAPGLFCVEVNPGGKETICGADYSHPGVRLLQQSGLVVWVLLLLAGAVELFAYRVTRPAVGAWLASALLLVGLLMLWLALPVVDSP